jgi:hypothetical protein
MGVGGKRNKFTVDNSIMNMPLRRFCIGMMMTNNSAITSYGNEMIIRNGSVFDYGNSSGSYRYLNVGYPRDNSYAGSSSNRVVVTDFTTKCLIAWLYLGTDTDGGNTFEVVDNALVRINIASYVSAADCIVIGSADGNKARLAHGFMAVQYNRTTVLADEEVEVWSGSDWVAGEKDVNWTATYYPDDASALAATGYDGLGDFTVITGGESLNPPLPTGTVLIIN